MDNILKFTYNGCVYELYADEIRPVIDKDLLVPGVTGAYEIDDERAWTADDVKTLLRSM